MSARNPLLDHPLAAIGRCAVAAADAGGPSAETPQFESAIRDYSANRAGLDWPLVERLGSALAAQRCDLKAYSYLALAAFCSRLEDLDDSPYAALGAALTSLGDVIEQGWERCSPRLPARREVQLKWVSEELAIPVAARPPRPAEVPLLLACCEAAERVAELGGKALGKDYLLLRELRSALAAHKPATPPPVTPSATPAAIAARPSAPEPTAAKQAPAAASPRASPATETAPATSELAAPLQGAAALSGEALEEALGELVVRLAAERRGESLADPASYWLLRTLRWAGHDLLREERAREILASQGQTPLPPPPDYKFLMTQLPERLAAGHHADVLGECEELFATYPLWLDLQRFAAMALAALGATAAYKVVLGQVRLLLERCPQLASFRFGDREGTPLADAETTAWLQAVCQQAGAAPLGRRSADDDDGEAAGSRVDIPDELEPGVRKLQLLLSQAGATQRRFELQLQLGEFLLAKQRSDIAMPIVEALLGTVESHQLVDWQPELAEQALRLAVRAGRQAELAEVRRKDLWSRLCRLSPSAALLLGPEILSG